jgi:bifunctional non-homologous end joining protein LigD
LLIINGEATGLLPLGERKARLEKLLKKPPAGVAYSTHEQENGERLRLAACEQGMGGIVSKRIDQPYKLGERGTWVKSKCLNRAEFVVALGAIRKAPASSLARNCLVITRQMVG